MLIINRLLFKIASLASSESLLVEKYQEREKASQLSLYQSRSDFVQALNKCQALNKLCNFGTKHYNLNFLILC